MSLEHALTIAHELAALTDGASASVAGNAESIAAILDRREAIIWRLRGACSPATLSAAPPAERRRLIELLRDAEVATRAMLEAAARERAMSLVAIERTRSDANSGSREEPRFTECAA